MWKTLLKIFTFQIFIIFISLLTIIFITLTERKFLGILNYRKGPNFFLFNSLIHSIIDFIKLVTKKTLKINFIFKQYWILIIFFGIIIFIIIILIFPIINRVIYIYLRFYIFFLIYSLIAFFFLILSYSSNSIFSIISIFRVLIQIIRYEVGIIFLFIFPLVLINEINFYFYYLNFNLILTFSIIFFFLIFLISLREINRIPFEFLERETELVSGFNVEYFSSLFRFIFLIEYGFFLFIILILNFFFIINFLFSLIIIILFIWSRSFIPRYRYDKILIIFWKDLVVTTIIFYLFINLI